MSELVKALRDAYEETDTVYFHLRTIINAAADTIDRLTAENAELVAYTERLSEIQAKKYCDVARENAELLQKTQQLTAELAALKEAHRWIPVTERLPDVLETVLIISDGEVGAGIMLDDDYWADGADVTHWMPLPAQPEKEEGVTTCSD